MKSTTPALVDDLFRVREHGKAEIVDGELVLMSPTGAKPSRAAGSVYASLRAHERTRGGGLAYPDNAAFIVDLPRRKSFSPDAAFHKGVQPTMKFVDRAPVFAVEVRSEGDYGPRAETVMAEKRADYFAAGTEVVWDVDLLSDDAMCPPRPRSAKPNP